MIEMRVLDYRITSDDRQVIVNKASKTKRTRRVNHFD